MNKLKQRRETMRRREAEGRADTRDITTDTGSTDEDAPTDAASTEFLETLRAGAYD